MMISACKMIDNNMPTTDPPFSGSAAVMWDLTYLCLFAGWRPIYILSFVNLSEVAFRQIPPIGLRFCYSSALMVLELSVDARTTCSPSPSSISELLSFLTLPFFVAIDRTIHTCIPNLHDTQPFPESRRTQTHK